MTVAKLIPTIQSLSHTDKLLLLQVLVQELLEAEGITEVPLPSGLDVEGQNYTSGRQVPSPTLAERRAFLQKPLAERQRILAAQANDIQSHYERDSDWQDLMAGDIVDY